MRVLVTREELVARVESLGHDAVFCELIRVEPLGDEPVDARAYDWLVVTSRSGAYELARRGVTANRIAAIGPATAEALASHGLYVDLVAATHTQEGLRDELPDGTALLAAAEGARQGVLQADFLPLYRTIELRPDVPESDLALLMSGSAARALALRDAGGRLYVGPDNGLLLPAAERFGGVAEAHELANAEYSLQPVSRTFHGRDLFSPAAAHLATGVALEELGPPVDPGELVRLDVPQPEVGHNRIRAVALVVDRFGNVSLNLRREHLEHADLAAGTRVEVLCHGERFYAVSARTFADAPRGSLILYEDAYGSLALAVSRGSAAQLLRVEEGAEIVLDLAVR